MIKKLKIPIAFLMFFFLLPIIVGQLPFPNNKKYEIPMAEEQLAYAAQEVTPTAVTDIPSQPSAPNSLKVLMFFTHSHETYKPFVADKQGKTAVYDTKNNLFTMKQTMADYFRLNGITVNTLDVDVMNLLKEKGLSINKAYDVVRPYIKEELQKNNYDLIIDIHRDSVSKKASTVSYQDINFAKVAFIIGLKNPNYEYNLSYAEKISNEMNKIVPNISRGIIKKKGSTVNSIYNQDLSKNLLLIEIGGIDNTEEEVYRTASVLAQAISNVLNKK